MTETAAPPPARPRRVPADLFAGSVLAVSAIVTVVMILHHPTLHGTPHDQVMSGLRALSGIDRLVHGTLIAVMGAMLLGLQILTTRLGWTRPLAAGGFIAYAAGTLFVCLAAIFDGFMIPDLAAHCTPGAQPCEANMLTLLTFVGVAIQNFTKVGLVAQTVGVVLWSIALLSGREGWAGRVVGGLGVALGLVPAGMMIFQAFYFTPHTLLMIFLFHAAWYLALGVLLIGKRRAAE